jgi:signal recognition particle GTPase
LLQADVGVRIVADFRDNVKKKILSGDASNISKKREIQKVKNKMILLKQQ